MIRSLSDSAALLSGRIPGFNDTGYAAEQFCYVVDLRPAESTLAVESERFINRRIMDAWLGRLPIPGAACRSWH
jgi:hypothetical protein